MSALPNRTLTIEVPEGYNLNELIEALARLGIQVSSPSADGDESLARRASSLDLLVANGGIMSLPDPSDWQREVRGDRPLP